MLNTKVQGIELKIVDNIGVDDYYTCERSSSSTWAVRWPFIYQARKERPQLLIIHADVGVLGLRRWSCDFVCSGGFPVLTVS